jgi:hypothetical protein
VQLAHLHRGQALGLVVGVAGLVPGRRDDSALVAGAVVGIAARGPGGSPGGELVGGGERLGRSVGQRGRVPAAL